MLLELTEAFQVYNYPSPPRGERSDTPGRAGKRAPGGATAYMIEHVERASLRRACPQKSLQTQQKLSTPTQSEECERPHLTNNLNKTHANYSETGPHRRKARRARPKLSRVAKPCS